MLARLPDFAWFKRLVRRRSSAPAPLPATE
jgi:hypothetical protein